jgi:hypothetical protein
LINLLPGHVTADKAEDILVIISVQVLFLDAMTGQED